MTAIDEHDLLWDAVALWDWTVEELIENAKLWTVEENQ